MRRIIILTVIITLVVYIPYLYFFESSMILPQNHHIPVDAITGVHSDDKQSYMSTQENLNVIGQAYENQSLKDLIRLHQTAGNWKVNRAAPAAIRGLGTREAQEYIVKGGSLRQAGKAISDASELKVTEFISP